MIIAKNVELVLTLLYKSNAETVSIKFTKVHKILYFSKLLEMLFLKAIQSIVEFELYFTVSSTMSRSEQTYLCIKFVLLRSRIYYAKNPNPYTRYLLYKRQPT